MKQIKNNQAGFSSTVIILVMVIVVLIAAVGWLVYDRNHGKHSRTSTSTTVSESSTASNAPQTSGSYLIFKEWGVRAPYTDNDTYSYSLSDDKTVASVISKNLAAKDSGCADFGAGQISRLTANDYASPAQDGPKVSQDYKDHPENYAKIGDYYYRFRHDQAGCGRKVTAEEQNQANAAVSALIKKFEAIPAQ